MSFLSEGEISHLYLAIILEPQDIAQKAAQRLNLLNPVSDADERELAKLGQIVRKLLDGRANSAEVNILADAFSVRPMTPFWHDIIENTAQIILSQALMLEVLDKETLITTALGLIKISLQKQKSISPKTITLLEECARAEPNLASRINEFLTQIRPFTRSQFDTAPLEAPVFGRGPRNSDIMTGPDKSKRRR